MKKLLFLSFLAISTIFTISKCTYNTTIEFFIDNKTSSDVYIVTMSLDSIPIVIDKIILEPGTKYLFTKTYHSDEVQDVFDMMETIKFGKRYNIIKNNKTYTKDLQDPDIYTFESDGRQSGTLTLEIFDIDF